MTQQAGAAWVYRLWLDRLLVRLAQQQTDRQTGKKMGAFDRVEERQTRTSVREGSDLGATNPPRITKQGKPKNQ